MPNRVIKESIWTSPNLNKLSDLAERHFYRILLLPDDFGCCELTSLVVKGRCYPLKEKGTISHIEQWNLELEQQDIIRSWKDNGRIYAYFPTFSAHQRIRSLHQRKTPEPPEDVICRQVTSSDDKCHPNPNPNPNPNPSINIKNSFDEFWLSYPNKVGKVGCLKKWMTLQKTKTLPSLNVILNAIERQKEWRKNTTEKFVPEWKNPETWLNKGCWEDQPEMKVSKKYEDVNL